MPFVLKMGHVLTICKISDIIFQLELQKKKNYFRVINRLRQCDLTISFALLRYAYYVKKRIYDVTKMHRT